MNATTKIFLSLLLFLFLFISCKTESTNTVTPTFSAQFGASTKLPINLKEASGITIDANDFIWINMDHGNEAILYIVNKAGTLIKEVAIPNVSNNDWEDLTKDNDDHLFIGDFGNNDNDRTNLAIYSISNFSTATTITNLETIQFYFEDQDAFPPTKNNRHFDVEAFIEYQNNLYLFTKDRSDPFEGITKLYRIPAQPGNHKAILLGQISTASSKKKGAITSGAISPGEDKLLLISEQRIFLFKNFETDNFFEGTLEIIDLPVERKFEGIEFLDDCNLLLVNEQKYGVDPHLFELSICE